MDRPEKLANRAGLTETADEKRIPYRHPQPKHSPPELVIPDVLPTDERLWVPQAENVWFRPLCLSASRGYWQNLLRVQEIRRAVAPPPSAAGARLRAEGRVALPRARLGRRPKAPMSTRRRARRTRSSSRTHVDGDDHHVPGQRLHDLRRPGRRRAGLRGRLHQDRHVPSATSRRSASAADYVEQFIR